ncbi:HNH endonuclease [Acinetobacter wanghuae]|uniref:HNH endonuclease n=1 Tax=Acinetobacter wanghuae TaxID=2662362 RepID=A0A5Q0P3V3_9GAMM|nr:HNH endonuclease [Acinetobacter wanghuae]MQW92232.1 HNH endonuclease [Acinetobacter wanghuae]QGA10478.1 HNH endonuclease [Acinetobacter wanghuae]
MSEWLFPVNPDIYDIDRAYHDAHQICWAKYDFEFQINDILFLYVTEPIGKIQYQYQVIGFIGHSDLPEKDREYWLDQKELEAYKGDYFLIQPIEKVEKASLSRRYLAEQGLITAKDTLQSHKTTKFVKGKSLDKVEAHKKLLSYIAEQFRNVGETNYPDEAGVNSPKFLEGKKITVTVNGYERCSKARAECIALYGTRCYVCGMSFEHTYGAFAKDFIHVHHIEPLHTIAKEYEVNPQKDLRPVCPNCHAMLHKTVDGIPMTIEKLKVFYKYSLNNPLRQTFEE